MGLVLRQATPSDAGLLLELIGELALYEREPAAVRTTAERLRAQLAQPEPPFECVIADWDGEPVGFALFFATYSTWRGAPGIHLEDLFVRERARRRGVGRALLQHLARLVLRRGGARLEWAVLDWNAPALAFYRSLGAEALNGWTTHRLSDGPLRALAEG